MCGRTSFYGVHGPDRGWLVTVGEHLISNIKCSNSSYFLVPLRQLPVTALIETFPSFRKNTEKYRYILEVETFHSRLQWGSLSILFQSNPTSF